MARQRLSPSQSTVIKAQLRMSYITKTMLAIQDVHQKSSITDKHPLAMTVIHARGRLQLVISLWTRRRIVRSQCKSQLRSERLQ
jgi:hypothetical protein